MTISVKGGRIVSVAAKRMKAEHKFEGLNVNIDLMDVSAGKDAVTVQYEYTTTYLPDVAEMKIVGEAWLVGSPAEQKEILDHWKKNKQLPVQAAESLLTALSYTNGSVGTLLAYAINISAPINVSRVSLPRDSGVSKQKAG